MYGTIKSAWCWMGAALATIVALGAAQNKLPFDVNLHVSGGLTPLNGTSDVDAVAPNATVVLSYYVPASAGPGPADGAAVAYTYRSTVDPQAHDNAGLVGALVVSSQVRERGRPLARAGAPVACTWFPFQLAREAVTCVCHSATERAFAGVRRVGLEWRPHAAGRGAGGRAPAQVSARSAQR